MSARTAKALRLVAAILAVLAGLGALVAWLNVRGEEPLDDESPPAVAAGADAVSHGAYLARAGNCIGCHTARGGAEYAGGRGIETPFGTVYASNLTPDADTGLGRWTAAEFRRALRHGRSRDGRLLYPAFPYPSYTLVSREDADALYAFLRSLPPVRRANRPHELRFPYNLQASLAVWRALYFRPAGFRPDAAQSPEWNRGAYLVRGLGHCVACHGARNWLGATRDDGSLGGGPIPMQGWVAPSLAAAGEAGVAGWPLQDIVALLRDGIAPRGSAMGPMAEVVYRSTQHLREDDLRAMALYLQALPQRPARPEPAAPAPADVLRLGSRLYADRCAACHGEQGEGVPGLYPALAGNRAVTLQAPHNVVKAILHGGFAPATAGNPRPFGMPPFKQVLSEAEVAAVATHLRQSWGHAAGEVTLLDVHRAR